MILKKLKVSKSENMFDQVAWYIQQLMVFSAEAHYLWPQETTNFFYVRDGEGAIVFQCPMTVYKAYQALVAAVSDEILPQPNEDQPNHNNDWDDIKSELPF